MTLDYALENLITTIEEAPFNCKLDAESLATLKEAIYGEALRVGLSPAAVANRAYSSFLQGKPCSFHGLKKELKFELKPCR